MLGQALLAKYMGKKRIIAETGAGQHGVATATVAALLGLECEIFMGLEDTKRQALNVYRMELLGAKVNAVEAGTQTLKDAVNEAMREWSKRTEDTLYVLGSVMGPHPFPMIVRDFQSIISKEARAQILEKEGRLPDVVTACVGGGSNAMGMFYNFINDKTEINKIICVPVMLAAIILSENRGPSAALIKQIKTVIDKNIAAPTRIKFLIKFISSMNFSLHSF